MKECTSNEPVNITIKVIGGKWKTLILWLLNKNDTLRFNNLMKQMPGVTQKMLTQQLRELEADGLIIRKIYPVVPPKVEYSLSEYGKSLNPILKEMAEWGETHYEKFKVASS